MAGTATDQSRSRLARGTFKQENRRTGATTAFLFADRQCSSGRAGQGGDKQEALADRKVELETTTSQLRDLDYAEAVSRMNQQLVGLQAAQASYSKIAQLSLFDYLR